MGIKLLTQLVYVVLVLATRQTSHMVEYHHSTNPDEYSPTLLPQLPVW
jgi:hypothetical protein